MVHENGNFFPTSDARYFPTPAGTLISADDNYPLQFREIPSEKTARYYACSQVILKPGFHAANGSDFKAKMLPCGTRTNHTTGRIRTNEIISAAYSSNTNEVAPTAEEGTSDQIVVSYPNPFVDKLLLDVRAARNGPFMLSVYSLQGANLFNARKSLETGKHSLEYDLSFLQNGIYLFVLSTPGYSTAIKIEKK